MPFENETDDLLDCLANTRRRVLLARLDDNRTPISGCELARLVAASETTAPEDGLPTERIQRVYLSLHHGHLPKLAAADVVDYDEETHRVAEGPRFDAALEFLERVERHADSNRS